MDETPSSEYAARRARLAEAVGSDSLLLLFAPGDSDHAPQPFNQEENLYYLTGLEVPDMILALVPGESDPREILFLPAPDQRRELWSGALPTPEEAAQRSGIHEVVSKARFDAFLRAALDGAPWGSGGSYPSYEPPGLPRLSSAARQGQATLWLLLGSREQRAEPRAPALGFAAELRRHYPELRFRDATAAIEALREVKSSAELRLIQGAVDITVEAQKAAMRRAPGCQHEYQIQASAEFTCRDLGASGLGFPTIAAAGAHATVLHYAANNGAVADDDLILLDLGARLGHYTADITRTFPARGRFTPAQGQIYEAVLAVWEACLELMRPGNSLRQVHLRGLEVLGRELVGLGLVCRNEPEQVALYFPHGIGHPLGLSVHDVLERSRPFEPGMVLTLEPGLYIRRPAVLASELFRRLPVDDQSSVADALELYAGIGVRIEDDILVTEGEPRLLSDGAPRTVEEIEGFMRP